jgi:hypothetical protein
MAIHAVAMLSATPWYDSGTLVSVAGVVLSALAIVVTVWATLYAIRPRQALYYKLKSARPVRDSDAYAPQDSASGLAHLKILTICLRGRGRKDVSSAAFDSAAPIAIKVGGPIVELIGKPVSFPPERSVPKAEVVGGRLEIGPGLIGRSQLLTYTVLADVPTPRVTVEGSLIDVRISRRDDRFGGLFQLGWLGFFAVLVFAVNNGTFWHLHARPFSELRTVYFGRLGAYILDAVAILYLVLVYGVDVWNWLQ